MLLKQLIDSPKTSSKLLVYDPFRNPQQEELVREVIGLANAEVEGARNILFGVNPGSSAGNGIVGIAESDMADLKKAHRLLSELIEPVLQLAFIYDRINGKLVGTLEIDGCEGGPFVVARDHSERLSSGQCWVREGYDLREVESGEIAPSGTPEPTEKIVTLIKPPPISVGFHEDPECQVVELRIPDSSNPPFADERPAAEQPMDLKQTIREKIGTVTTQILRLGRPAAKDAFSDTAAAVTVTQTDACDGTDKVVTDANNHYFFEECAVQLNLSVCSKGTESIDKVSIELGFPRPADFDVADRLYISPFDKRSPVEIKNLGYPDVERRDDSIRVQSSIGTLVPEKPEPAFKCPLRMAVGPGMQRRKIAIHYKIRGPNNQRLAKGRLKIEFGKVSA